MKDDAFKVQLFRFVDTFPMLKTPEQIGRIRAAGRVVAECHALMREMAKPGAISAIRSTGARPEMKVMAAPMIPAMAEAKAILKR